MPIDHAALKTELQTDPSAIGYAALLAAGNHTAVADALNIVRPSIDIERQVVDSYEIINAIAPADWTALSATERQRIDFIVGAGRVDVKNANVRSQFLAAFGAGTATRTALAALQTRKGSRAEQLFGAGASVHFRDIDTAVHDTE